MCLDGAWFVAAFHPTPIHDPGPEEFQPPCTLKAIQSMLGKHPQTPNHSWEVPVPSPDVPASTDCVNSTLKSQGPLTGTGPRFFRPDFVAAFLKGVFTDEKAKEAPVPSKKSGLLYLTAKMPPWMRLKLARAVGKRLWGCRAKRLYVHKVPRPSHMPDPACRPGDPRALVA